MNKLIHDLIDAGVTFDLSIEGEVDVRMPKYLEAPLRQRLLNNTDSIKSFLLSHQSQASKIKEAPDMKAYPVSSAQRQVWIAQSLASDKVAFHMPSRFHVKGSLDISILSEAFQVLLKRHSILRTVYETTDSGLLQIVRSGLKLTIKSTALSSLFEPEQQLEIDKISQAMRTDEFDLKRAPPLRVHWVELNADYSGVLFLTCHHIAADGWSLDLLLKELIAIYEAIQKGINFPTLSKTLGYHDYAYWEASSIKSSTLLDEREYWSKQLEDIPDFHELCSRQTSANAGSLSSRIRCKLSRALSKAVIECSESLGMTPFMFLHAAFSILVSKLSGQSDVVVGIPNNSRDRESLRHVVGLFLTTQVLRVNTKHLLLVDYLNSVKQTHLDAHKYSKLPFEELVKLTASEYNHEITPLFQIFLNSENVIEQGEVISKKHYMGDAELCEWSYDQVVSKHDIDLTFAINSETVELTWVFKSDIFTMSRIKSFHRGVVELLSQMTQKDIEQIGMNELTLMSEKMQLEMLRQTEPVTQAEIYDESISHLFKGIVEKKPNSIALRHNECVLSYKQLDRQVNQLANYLMRELGVNPGMHVGICMRRGFPVFTAVLAVVRCGAVFVPMEASYPSERLNYILDDAEIKVLICDYVSASELPGRSDIRKVILDDEGVTRLIAEQDPREPTLNTKPNDNFYIYYTSGSTGKPKGVIANQSGTLNRFQWMWRLYPFASGERTCFKTALSFIDAIWEVFGGLLKGIETVIVDESQLLDNLTFLGFLAERKVTRLVIIPSLLNELMEYKSEFNHSLETLRLITVSGEELRQSVVQRFNTFSSSTKLLNLYGSSEVSADVTFYECKKDGFSSIGRTIDHMYGYVVDYDTQLLPDGEVGELCVSGPGIADGYYNNPELTKSRFVKNPFINQVGHERMFRTGDRVYRDQSGRLQFVGRVDRQVKLNGMRIELTDVERNIETQKQVKRCAVQVRPLGQYSALVAFVEPQGAVVETEQGKNVFTQLVMRAAKQSLPPFMVPKFVEVIVRLPLLYNGKIDYRKLRGYSISLPATGGNVEALTEYEYTLAEIWSSQLDVSLEQLEPDSDFFELGGHSLQAMNLIKRIECCYSVVLPIRTIFEQRTLANIASEIALSCSRQLAESANSNSNVEMDF